MNKRIVITGMGVVSPIGLTVESFTRNLFNGTCGIREISFPYRGQDVRFPAAPLSGFDPTAFLDAKKLPLMDRFSQIAVCAARQAFEDANLALSAEESARTAVITGTGVGGQNTLEDSYMKLLDAEGSPRVPPLTIPRLMANAATSHISMDLNLTGPAFTVASACASALHALSVALTFLRSGLADRVVTGGSESCLTFGTLKSWEALRVMSPDVCRPFSNYRAGMVLGEGAAMFVLETEDAARARGAKSYAEIAGFGLTSDAKDLTSPDVASAAQAMSLALADAHLSPADIDLINAHGTGTRINNLAESAAIHRVFGAETSRVAVTANKSLFGHALGAAGALELAATVLSVQKDLVPPTANYLGPDPDCVLDIVTQTARTQPIRAAMKNAFAFGGLNAVTIIKKT